MNIFEIVLLGILSVALGQQFPDPDDGLVALADGQDTRAARYFVSTFMANSFDADLYCRGSGRTLLGIETDVEQTEIVRLLVSSSVGGRYYWTSGADFVNEGQLIWTSTGQNFGYTNFAPSWVNNEVNDCVWVAGDDWWNYAWMISPCSDLHHFICEN